MQNLLDRLSSRQAKSAQGGTRVLPGKTDERQQMCKDTVIWPSLRHVHTVSSVFLVPLASGALKHCERPSDQTSD